MKPLMLVVTDMPPLVTNADWSAII